MRRMMVPAVVVLAALASPPQARAQTPSQDERDVLAVVEKLFDGMRTKDTAMMRSLFDTSARLVTTSTRDGKPVIREAKIMNFLASIGRSAPTDTLIERIYDPEVRVSDNLATVWMEYTFHVNSRFSHCGYDAVQLARGPEGWKIVALADTQRREGCKRAG
ncbi:MAG TPA: nuclear transport factor 2 family protein [Gemmatimonadaceae bacterium]|nr:nuclear transport factor 2 family protein [Gemmatimonadaceae bacterium]